MNIRANVEFRVKERRDSSGVYPTYTLDSLHRWPLIDVCKWTTYQPTPASYANWVLIQKTQKYLDDPTMGLL